MGGVIDATEVEESKLGVGVATNAVLRNANNPFSFETKKFVYNICAQRTSSLKAVTNWRRIKDNKTKKLSKFLHKFLNCR